MSEVKHTPGPWRYGAASLYDGFYIAPDARLLTLAAVHNFPGQAEANARLIAAAPDLWANGCAADTCLSMAYSYARELGRDDEARHINEVQVALRAAIAKAEGRS